MPPFLDDALRSTGRFLLTTVPFFVLGVILAQLLVELGWLSRFGWLARPLTRWGHLQPECAGSFLVTLVSPTAGHSMLKKYYDDRRIERREVIIAAIVNTLPGYIAQGRTTLPLTVPLLGVFGVVYYVLVVLADLLKAAVMLAVGSFVLPRRDPNTFVQDNPDSARRPGLRTAFRRSLPKSQKTILRVLRTMLPVTFVVFLLLGLGTFNQLAAKMGAVARYFPIPLESVPIVATRLASPVGAYTVAGNLLSKGVAEGKDIVLALLVGSLLATLPNMRYLIPYYFGIFGPKLGTEVIIVSTVLRLVSFGLIIGGVSFLYL